MSTSVKRQVVVILVIVICKTRMFDHNKSSIKFGKDLMIIDKVGVS